MGSSPMKGRELMGSSPFKGEVGRGMGEVAAKSCLCCDARHQIIQLNRASLPQKLFKPNRGTR